MVNQQIELTPAQRQEFDRKYLQLRKKVVRGMNINDARRSLHALFAALIPATQEEENEAREN